MKTTVLVSEVTDTALIDPQVWIVSLALILALLGCLARAAR